MKTLLLQQKDDLTLNVTEDTRYLLELQPNTNVSVVLNFKKQGIEAEIIGLYVLKDSEKLVLSTTARHIATNTKCTTSVRGVLLDYSQSEYVGKIIIEKSGQNTVSYLDDKVLALGKGAKNVSQPILEIEADDVKASHGSTTGRIDEDQLFYLQSRGFSRPDAEKAIIRGFFTEVMPGFSESEKDEIMNKLRI